MQNKDQHLSFELARYIKQSGKEVGFSKIGITDTNLSEHKKHLSYWLKKGYNANMDYLSRYESIKIAPEKLLPDVKTIISCAVGYFSENSSPYISLYATRKDYHKVVLSRLKKLVKKIKSKVGDFKYRCFVDTAPVMEKTIALKAGIGWQGKNSLIINPDFGSYMFLGEIFSDLDLPLDKPIENLCGTCDACIKACPTGAIVEPFKIDARRCIAYLTIEHKEENIQNELKFFIGKHVYGCDECQVVCPWNKNLKDTTDPELLPKSNLTEATLAELSNWDEEKFLEETKDTPIKRLGYKRWIKNIMRIINK